jgi:DNA-binding transcriptional regulator YiaG
MKAANLDFCSSWSSAKPLWALALLGSYHRTARIVRQSYSLHFTRIRRYPASPKTLGEHLHKKRVDLGLSMPKLIQLLGLSISDTTVEKWEKNQNRPTEPFHSRIVEFLGFDPELENQTGGST